MQVVKITSRIGRMMCWPKSRYKGAGEQYPVEELPLRAELWNVEQLERHARTIAGIHRLSTQKADDKLLPRLMENERILITTYDQIAAAAARNRRIVPAAEWLLDNFYLIEEQIRSTRNLLPRSYSGELPRLANRAHADYPRVYRYRPRTGRSHGRPHGLRESDRISVGISIRCAAEAG
jgi:hypothetical protein